MSALASRPPALYFASQSEWRPNAEAGEVRGTRVGGDYAEVAATHSRCNRDGLLLGRGLVRCGLRAAVDPWREYRPPTPSRLRRARLHCRDHILRASRADRGPSQV